MLIVLKFGSLNLLEPSGPVQALYLSLNRWHIFFSLRCANNFWASSSIIVSGYRGNLRQGWSGCVLELTTNLKIVLRLRMRAAILLLLLHLCGMQRDNFTFIFTDAVLFKCRHSDVGIENCNSWWAGPCAYTITVVQGMATKDSYMRQQCLLSGKVCLLQGILHVSETFTIWGFGDIWVAIKYLSLGYLHCNCGHTNSCAGLHTASISPHRCVVIVWFPCWMGR